MHASVCSLNSSTLSTITGQMLDIKQLIKTDSESKGNQFLNDLSLCQRLQAYTKDCNALVD